MTYPDILKQIKSRKFAPIYYLHGEESFLIDKIYTALDEEGVVLDAGSRDFNRELFFGPETKANQILNACRSFPVMAQHRLVILKEAHRMSSKELELLTPYLKKPVPSTVLVLLFKDRRSALPKTGSQAAGKNGVNFHAKKLYDRDVMRWVDMIIQEAGYETDPEVAGTLVTNLGLDLGLIENELGKMFIFLKATGQTHLKKDFVYQMINVDKTFNAFELVHALSQKQAYRSHMIINRLTQNLKVNPPTVIVSSLFRFFHHVALVHRHKLRDPNSVKHQLGVNYFQAKDCISGARYYPLPTVYRNIGLIEAVDLKLKGQIRTDLGADHHLKTLVWQLLA